MVWAIDSKILSSIFTSMISLEPYSFAISANCSKNKRFLVGVRLAIFFIKFFLFFDWKKSNILLEATLIEYSTPLDALYEIYSALPNLLKQGVVLKDYCRLIL